MSYPLIQTVTLHFFVLQSQWFWQFAAGCMIDAAFLPYSDHLYCSVDSQDQGKARRLASEVQHRDFLVSQLNALDKLVDVACLVDS